jgi:hypothetical protein
MLIHGLYLEICLLEWINVMGWGVAVLGEKNKKFFFCEHTITPIFSITISRLERFKHDVHSPSADSIIKINGEVTS